MNSIRLFWEHSPFWLLGLLPLAALLAWWQYRGQKDFSTAQKIFPGFLRFLAYFIIGLLLLNPLLRYYKENILPPVTVILTDNSRSVQMTTSPDSLRLFRQNFKRLKDELEKAGSKVYIEDLNGSIKSADSLRFNNESSNLEAALRRIREAFDGQNLNQLILASDGIINQGGDLQDLNSSFRVHSIGLGNPKQSRDLNIRDLRHNKTTFLGNQFPVQVEILGTGLKSNSVGISLLENGKLLEKRQVSLSPAGLASAEFMLKADKKGLHEYVVSLDAQEGEITLENNRRIFFIEVATNRQKVLLLAASPHPDLKAIRSALEPLEQIELSTCIGGMDAFRPDSYNLVILHQLPDKQGNFATQVNQYLQGSGTPVWLISTSFTDFGKLRSAASSWLGIGNTVGRHEESGNQFDEAFQGYLFEEEYRKILGELPPVKVPGTSFTWKGNSETVIRQLIGRVSTPTPLLSVQDGKGVRRAVFWGDGLWLWRLNEFGRSEKTIAVDNLIQKTALLLLSDSRKKQLIVTGNADEYAESEVPAFRIETFNQLMEPVYDQKVGFRVTGNSGKSFDYQFVTTSGNPQFRIQSLPPGAYQYAATARIDGKDAADEGNFIVRAFDLEARELAANHALLQELARKGKGRFTGINGMMQLAAGSEIPPPTIEFTEWNENLLGLKTLLIILLSLLCLEWLYRKFFGVL